MPAPSAELPIPLVDTSPRTPAPAEEAPVPAPAIAEHYPPHRYHVEGQGTHLIAAGAYDLYSRFPSDHWIVGGDPVVIEIHFDKPISDPAAVIRQVREKLVGAVVHDEGDQDNRVYLMVTVPPGIYRVDLPAGERLEAWRDHRTLVLHRGCRWSLTRWEPGGSPESLGEYELTSVAWGIHAAAFGAERDEAFFFTIPFSGEGPPETTCLWRWEPGAQPCVALLPGSWTSGCTGREWVLPRSGDLVLQSCWSVTVVDRSGEQVATLGQGDSWKRYSYGVAVGPGDEVAVFLGRRGETGLELDLIIFNADLELYRTWDGICRQGRFNDGTPDVHPIWWEDEVFFLALDDTGPGTPVYHLMAMDVDTGSLRRVLGPFARGRRVGQSTYVLEKEDGAATVLWDPATRSLRTLPSARDVGERGTPWPLATNGDWVVLYSSESGLLGWHPSLGITRLGPGTAVVRAGEAFLWWTEVR
ncbi:MAG: hypothetical protein RDU89_11705 [bacterium]|nr:hypothetical protein [bacterium]